MTGGVIKTGASKQIDGKEYTSRLVIKSGGQAGANVRRSHRWYDLTIAWQHIDPQMAPKTVITGDVSVKVPDVIRERQTKVVVRGRSVQSSTGDSAGHFAE